MAIKFRVHYTEYERGWGSRPDGHSDYDTLAEARLHQMKFNAQNTEKSAPNWYMIAEDPVQVEVNEVKA